MRCLLTQYILGKGGSATASAVVASVLLTVPSGAMAQTVPPATNGGPLPQTAPVPPVTPPVPAPPPITVTVNGDAVLFGTQQPIEQEGTILVPLRGVFEKLGASVQFTGSTKTITAVRGSTTVTLRLGDSNAEVNGTSRLLTVVPQALNGVTVVPLRFVSEALGAQVAWKRDILTVVITTGAPHADQLPTPGGTDPVLGTVTGIFPEANSVTLRIPGGVNNRVTLDPTALLLIKGSDDGSEDSQPLSTLKPGDQVTITRDDKGKGTVLRVRTDQRRGPLKSVVAVDGGGSIVTLTDGSTVEIVSGVPVTMAGRPIALREVQSAENLVIRLDPTTKKGIGIAVATDDDPNPIPPIKVELSSVTQNSGGRTLRAEDTLLVTVTGTPGVEGKFSIPGAGGIENVPLVEQAPGVYTGTVTIPKGVTAQGASVIASLFKGYSKTPPTEAEGKLNIDASAPTLESVDPKPDSRTENLRTLIYGTYTDPGSGIDAAATGIIVDGKDVTSLAQITDSFFSFKPGFDLPLGKNTVAVVAKDKAGNEVRREWVFTISAPSNPITSLSVTPDDEPLLNAGAPITVRIQAPPGGQAKFSIGNAVKDQPMPEQAPGVYIGNYTVKQGDSVSRAPVAVVFKPANGPAISQVSGAQITLAAGAPETPVIERPREGVSVGKTVTITGRAAPGAIVRLKLVYSGKVLVIGTQGTIFDGDVRTGSDGRWSTGTVELNVPSSVTNISFTLTAVVTDGNGKLSDSTTVKFKQ
jgi:hypothetical protein